MVTFRPWGGRDAREPRQVWAEWMAANEAVDAKRAGRLAEEMTRVAPASFSAWFEAGLYAKVRRMWPECRDRNDRALALFGDAEAHESDGVNPAAWNLGIAATALAEWATARRAWTAYGITGLGDAVGPIDMDYGQVPIRLNPDRPSLPLQVVPTFGDTEVVWCWRRSPAHAVIANVPLPESGHRYGDVLLHDGEPKGTRRLDERQVSVFDELQKLEDSGVSTWQAEVDDPTAEDIDHLEELAFSRGIGADNWSGIRAMCSNCSHGTPETGHAHPPVEDGSTLLGLAGSETEVRQLIHDWVDAKEHLNLLGLRFLW